MASQSTALHLHRCSLDMPLKDLLRHRPEWQFILHGHPATTIWWHAMDAPLKPKEYVRRSPTPNLCGVKQDKGREIAAGPKRSMTIARPRQKRSGLCQGLSMVGGLKGVIDASYQGRLVFSSQVKMCVDQSRASY